MPRELCSIFVCVLTIAGGFVTVEDFAVVLNDVASEIFDLLVA